VGLIRSCLRMCTNASEMVKPSELITLVCTDVQIMTCLIEESDDVSQQLLHTILEGLVNKNATVARLVAYVRYPCPFLQLPSYVHMPTFGHVGMLSGWQSGCCTARKKHCGHTCRST
jgi:hypothetical protein